MTITTPSQSSALASDRRLDPGVLVFAVMDVTALGSARHRRDPVKLGYLFESTLPVPIEGVHAVYVPLDTDRVLACGMPEARLRELAGDALTLGPAELPPFARGLGVDPASINLLTGPFQPARLTRARRSLWLQTAAVVVLFGLVLGLGLERRAQAQRAHADVLGLATNQVYREVLPQRAGRARPNSIRLTTELRRLRQTRDRADDSEIGDDFNAGRSLAAVLSNWPADLELRTTSLSITQPRSTITALTTGPDKAQRLIDALREVDGQRVRDSRASRARDGTEVRVTLEPDTAREEPR